VLKDQLEYLGQETWITLQPSLYSAAPQHYFSQQLTQQAYHYIHYIHYTS